MEHLGNTIWPQHDTIFCIIAHPNRSNRFKNSAILYALKRVLSSAVLTPRVGRMPSEQPPFVFILEPPQQVHHWQICPCCDIVRCVALLF